MAKWLHKKDGKCSHFGLRYAMAHGHGVMVISPFSCSHMRFCRFRMPNEANILDIHCSILLELYMLVDWSFSYSLCSIFRGW